LAALATGDPDASRALSVGGQQVNQLSAVIERRPVRTLPAGSIASDLRLVAGLLHVNEHLERMGDLRVNLAGQFATWLSSPHRGALGSAPGGNDSLRPVDYPECGGVEAACGPGSAPSASSGDSDRLDDCFR
jgi:PhoU domain